LRNSSSHPPRRFDVGQDHDLDVFEVGVLGEFGPDEGIGVAGDAELAGVAEFQLAKGALPE